jgi:hypothetical protein
MMAVPDLGGASLSSFRGCRNRTGPDYGLHGQAPALVSRRSHGRQKLTRTLEPKSGACGATCGRLFAFANLLPGSRI